MQYGKKTMNNGAHKGQNNIGDNQKITGSYTNAETRLRPVA